VKSLRLLTVSFTARLFTALLMALTLMACASGEVDPVDGEQPKTDADTYSQDVFQGDTTVEPNDSGAHDVGDASSADTDDGGSQEDAGDRDDVGDAGDPDTGNPDTSGDDVGPDSGPSGQCTTDNDCANGGRCHDRESVCVPTCCDNVTYQDSFTAVSYSHNRFDIDVTDAGEPSIVFVDGDTNAIKYARSVNGQWLSQDIGTVSQSLSTHVRLSLAPDGTPHVIVGRYEYLMHFWQDGNGWQSHDLLTTPTSVGYIDIATDAQGGVHMVALLDYGDQILYAHRTAQGLRSEEFLSQPAPNNPVWTNIGVTSDGRPIASFQIGLDKTVVIAEKTASGAWSYEIVGQGVSQVHGLAVDGDDQPAIAYHKETNDGLRILRRQPQSWQDELIVADPDHGYSPDIAVDSLGDPHVVYMARGPGQYENPLYYARWDGAQWENHELTNVARAFYPRVALDASRTPHVVVYDPTNDTISYLKVQ
jgi:hypothetical protein